MASTWQDTARGGSHEHAQRWTLRDGSVALLRHVQPADAAPLQALLLRQDRETLRLRFHSSAGASGALVQRMACASGPWQLGLVLQLEGPWPTLIAEARYASDDGRAAEVALLVDRAWRRQGLAGRLLQALATAARGAGLHHLHGHVLDDNLAMLGLARRARWPVTRAPDDGRLCCVRLDLHQQR